MLNVRKYTAALSPMKNWLFYGTKASRPKPRNTRLSRERRREQSFGANPGVDLQLTALDLNEKERERPGLLEDMEKQFWDADKIQDDIDREKHIQKELLGIFQVTRKQFREEKSPNMLLWDEKHEIKALHAKDPEKWTIMRLAYSYPASPSIIKKILKTHWKLRSAADIEKHDEKVRRNWEALSKGKLEVPDLQLKKHLLSFSDRRKIISSSHKELVYPRADENDPLKDVLKDGGVFGNIYHSYQKLSSKNSSENEIKEALKNQMDKSEESSIQKGLKKLYHPPQKDTFIIPRSVQEVSLRTSEHLTMSEMQSRVVRDAEAGKFLSHDERQFAQDKIQRQLINSQYKGKVKDPVGCPPEHELSPGEQLVHLDDQNKSGKLAPPDDSQNLKFQHLDMDRAKKFVDISKQVDYYEAEFKEVQSSLTTAKVERRREDNEAIVKAVKNYMSNSAESYPLEIVIPKNLWRKGALYQVKDRFYTDDGEFLYRVPGLTKE